MATERYFIEEPLALDDEKILRGAEFHHLSHVMRARKGTTIELVNGQGVLAYAKIEELFKDHALVTVQGMTSQTPPSMRTVLAQSLPRLNRLDFILEKGTELGVAEFWLFPSGNSVKKEISPHQLERFHALTVAAMKQCGSLFLPKIVVKPPLSSWPPLPGSAFFGDVEASATPFETKLNQRPLFSPLIFFVGPESGFTDKEISILREWGVEGVKLHNHILRTDTAPLVALSLMEHWLLVKSHSPE